MKTRMCLREPMVRRGDQWQKVSWDEAFAEIERGLTPILQEHGRDALAVYVGNPNAHNLASLLYLPTLLHAARTHNFYSASTVDQMPKQVSAGLMFGTLLSIPIPDVDRTDYLLLLGANPLVSNGSLMTAPDMRGRLRKLRQRGGKIVVIDPYRTRTAQEADEHHFIRPGSDAYFLFAIVNTLFAEGLAAPGRLSEHLNGLEEVRTLAEPFTPERVASACGIEAHAIRRIARELAAAPRAAVYGRIGTCTQTFGTLASWLVDVVNMLTGNLDREGGALFPRAAAGGRNTTGTGGRGRGVRFGRWKSRVRGLPEYFGELPAACLAEEIETPGKGQIQRIVDAGRQSRPEHTRIASRLQKALGTLDFMVSVDIYLNETTRYANVILPPPPSLARSHYDLAFYQLSVQNVAHYSPPIFEREAGTLDEWEIFLRLAAILAGQGAHADPRVLDELTAHTLVQREVATPGSNVEGRDVERDYGVLKPRTGPERLLDFLLRSGPYGDGFGVSQGLSLAEVEAHPHGVDLGPLAAAHSGSTAHAIRQNRTGSPAHSGGRRAVASRARARQHTRATNGHALLIGRRDLRSNNSWMHNLHVLTKGKDRCTLHIHPSHAARLSLEDGETACVTSRAGTVEIPIEVTDAIMPGVVSIPHGWGHRLPGNKHAHRQRTRRRQYQHPDRRRRSRSVVGQCGAERHSCDG